MKALVILLAVLLVLAHPVGVAVVLALEAVVVAGLWLLAWRGLRSLIWRPTWRRVA